MIFLRVMLHSFYHNNITVIFVFRYFLMFFITSLKSLYETFQRFNKHILIS